jgi:hypothetical protein
MQGSWLEMMEQEVQDKENKSKSNAKRIKDDNAPTSF